MKRARRKKFLIVTERNLCFRQTFTTQARTSADAEARARVLATEADLIAGKLVNNWLKVEVIERDDPPHLASLRASKKRSRRR